MRVKHKLKTPQVQQKIEEFKILFEKEVCVEILNAFWNKKQHVISLPYEKYFDEKIYSNKSKTHLNERKIVKLLQKRNSIFIRLKN